MSMLQEFKEFALKGNVIDFSNLFFVLNGQPVASLKEATDKGVPVLAYGVFINTVVCDYRLLSFHRD